MEKSITDILSVVFDVVMYLIPWVVFIGIVIFISTTTYLTDFLDSKFAQRIKYGFLYILYIFFFFLGVVVFYTTSIEIYEGYRIRNDSILIPGEIESSNYFKERRGSRKRRRNITGYQISVKFYDSGIEKIKKFEVKNQLDEGVKVNLYHVPNTDISSLDKDSAGGSFWLLFGSLGMMGFFGYSVFAIFTRKETN